MIQPWVPRKILSDLDERPVCSRQAQENRERSGQLFPLQENSMGGPSALDLFPLSNQYFRLAVPGQVPSSSPSAPVLYVKGPVPPGLSEQLMAKALHPGLGEVSSPAFTLVLLTALSSPLALAEPGLASLFFKLLRCSFCSSGWELWPHTLRNGLPRLLPAEADLPGKGAVNRLFQSGARKHRSHLLYDVSKGKSHDSARCQMTKRSPLIENCFQLLSSKWNESIPNQPVLPVFTHPWADEAAEQSGQRWAISRVRR